MPKRLRTSRRTPTQVQADAAAAALTVALGKAIREARRAAGLTQAEVGRRSALAQSVISGMERGAAVGMSLRTWTRVAHVLHLDIHAYLTQQTGTDAPRDWVHLRTQELVASLAERGRWASIPEFALDDAARGTRSVDLWLERRRVITVEVSIIEVMDWFEDVGARFRDWDRRLERARQLAVGTRTIEGPTDPRLPVVSGCWVVRATRRNRQLLHDHRRLFDARFRASGRRWLDAFAGDAPMPTEPAILWVSVDGTRLFPRQHGGAARSGVARPAVAPSAVVPPRHRKDS